jgi:hypothetical protein
MRQLFPVCRDLPAFDLILRKVVTEDICHHFRTLPSFDTGDEVELLIDGRIEIDRAAVAQLAVAHDTPFV